jgi:hypothetical protein
MEEIKESALGEKVEGQVSKHDEEIMKNYYME